MGPPTESLTTLIIVGTAASTGLIILVILNVFVCGCIVAMCMRRGRRQPTYVRCTPTLITPALAVPIVRVQQFEQDDDYTEIENVRPMQHEMTRQVQVQRVAMSQQHLAMRQWGPQNNHFASSQPYLTRGEWGSQRTAASEDNIYCSVLDSEEDLTEQPTQVRALSGCACV